MIAGVQGFNKENKRWQVRRSQRFHAKHYGRCWFFEETEDDETLDNTSSGSSLSDSSPPASSAIAAPTASSDPQVASSDALRQQQQEEEEDVEQQPLQQLDPLSAIQQELQAIEDEILEEELLKEEASKPTILKKQAKSPSVFGLNVVMESDDEMLEEEPDYDEASSSDVLLEESSTGSIIHKSSTIRWSDDEKEDVTVTVHEVECLKDNIDMWWQDAEFTTIKEGVNETIRFCKSYNRNQVELLEDILRCDCLEDDDLMNDLLQDLLQSSGSSDSSFTRGLEGKLSNLMEKYKKRHNRKVLSTQQKLSKTKNTHSEESIERLREESLERSQTLSSFARRMGQFDEMVAKKAQTTRKSLWDI